MAHAGPMLRQHGSPHGVADRPFAPHAWEEVEVVEDEQVAATGVAEHLEPLASHAQASQASPSKAREDPPSDTDSEGRRRHRRERAKGLAAAGEGGEGRQEESQQPEGRAQAEGVGASPQEEQEFKEMRGQATHA